MKMRLQKCVLANLWVILCVAVQGLFADNSDDLGTVSDYPVCTIGKNECDDKGWTSFGRLKNDVICYPDGQSFIINLSDTEHPCRCNTGGGR
ncbi:hypothetical protein V1264_020283 [Littorina saxatilis]|uniref:Secreted protein n=1 Tax=Littorina saxatilis TaxID=31220 RepID=A0AAN9GBC6_9CAEN